MSGYAAPSTLEEQTRKLIKSGIAQKVMRFLPSQQPDARNATLEECKFWAQWTLKNKGTSLEELHLQIAIRYPVDRSRSSSLFQDWAITVAVGGPWLLANSETLSTSQIALAESLAGHRPKCSSF